MWCTFHRFSVRGKKSKLTSYFSSEIILFKSTWSKLIQFIVSIRWNFSSNSHRLAELNSLLQCQSGWNEIHFPKRFVSSLFVRTQCIQCVDGISIAEKSTRFSSRKKRGKWDRGVVHILNRQHAKMKSSFLFFLAHTMQPVKAPSAPTSGSMLSVCIAQLFQEADIFYRRTLINIFNFPRVEMKLILWLQ